MINPAEFKEGELDAIIAQLETFKSDKDALHEKIGKYFAEFDKDGNGFLDRKELRQFLELFFSQYHIKFPLTDEYVDAVFRDIDTNHDNKIQSEELNMFASHFVGELHTQFSAAKC